MEKINPYVKLNSGYNMPVFGLGTSGLKETLPDLIYQSIKNGLRLIDTANVYNNEKEVGQGVRKAIEDGLIKREDIFIITKLSYHDKHDPEAAIKTSLQELGLDYIDLYLDHWSFSINKDREGNYRKMPLHIFWGIMEDLVKKGYTRSIGVCNYGVALLMNLLSFCEIKPAALEVEYHPYNYNYKLLEYCNQNDIRVIGFGSFVKANYTYLFHSNVEANLFKEEVVIKMAEKYNKTVGQVLLNWSLSQGLTVIPMSGNINRILENYGSIDFKLSDEDVLEIAKLNRSFRFCGSSVWPFSDGIDIFA